MTTCASSSRPSARSLDGADVTIANAVKLRDERGRTISGKLDYVAQSINPNTSTRLMRARLDEGSGLLPGDFVHVDLQIGVRPNAVRIPQKAVRQEPDGTYTVFLYKDGKARLQPVKLDRWDGPDWIATDGLAAGRSRDHQSASQASRRLRRAARTSRKDGQVGSCDMLSQFCIRRPIFATVLSIIIVLAGLIAMRVLPLSQYPDISPPTVRISTTYDGADAQTLARTVAAPIEDQLSGITGLLYYTTNIRSNGDMSISWRL